jgi:hypothetical protein
VREKEKQANVGCAGQSKKLSPALGFEVFFLFFVGLGWL